MSDEKNLSRHDQVLFGLVVSLQSATLQHLGKIVNPLTGKIERDLEQARGTIDILEMLKAKCRTDTPDQLLRMLDTAVMELQMNYVDEQRKERAQDRESKAAESAAEESAAEESAAEEPAAKRPVTEESAGREEEGQPAEDAGDATPAPDDAPEDPTTRGDG